MEKLNKEAFNFTGNGNMFKENLKGFIERNIKLKDDIVGWVIYDLNDDKLMFETLNELTLFDSLLQYEGYNMFLINNGKELKITLDNDFGSFTPVIKEIPVDKEMAYANALDNGDKEVFAFVKKLQEIDVITKKEKGNVLINLDIIEILESEVYKGEDYGSITPVDYVDAVKKYAKDNNINLGLLVDGYYEFEETDNYKVIQAVDYNADLNIGYGSVHLILLDKNSLETKDYYIQVSDDFKQ